MTLVAHYPLDGARFRGELDATSSEAPALYYSGGVRACAGPLDLPGACFHGGSAWTAPRPELSIATTGQFTISVWARPDMLTFPVTEGEGYVHLVSKGRRGEYEWCLRMYSADNQAGRANRISAYVFNPAGDAGAGSYFQDVIVAGRWLHVAATFDVAGDKIAIYRDGAPQDEDGFYYQRQIVPIAGGAPLELATRGGRSYFHGALADLRIYDRALSADEVDALYRGEELAR